MRNELDELLKIIGEDYKDVIAKDARNYLEVSLGTRAQQVGLNLLKTRFQDTPVIVPLKNPLAGMKVRIDGRTFKNYMQFDCGIAVPVYVARLSALPARSYSPQDSMILNFA